MNKEQLLSGILERDQETGRRFYDLSEVYSAEKILLAAAAVGVTYYGPNLAQIYRERERLLREEAEKETGQQRSYTASQQDP